MTHRTCAHCEASIDHRPARAIYCSKSCSVKASHLRDPSLRQRHQSRYRQSAKGKAAKRRYLKPRTCLGCGGTWLTENIRGKYCSQLCRDYHKWGPRFCPWTPTTRAVEVWKPSKRSLEAAPSPAPRLWVSGPCAWCAQPFTVHTPSGIATYCSSHCAKKAGRARRRANEAGSTGTYTWAEVTRLWISIGKTCAYCHRPKRNDEIEPDHVVPISRGGSNSITNVVPACHPCNGDKRDLDLNEWYATRKERGLEARVLHASLTHLTLPVAA